MGQQRQGGSTIGYVLIGMVLITVLVGGVYALRQATAQKPVEVVKQPVKDESTNKPEEERHSDETTQKSASTEEVSPSEETNTEPAQESAPHEEAAVQEPNISLQQTELPRTGAGDVTSWVALAFLAGAGAAYVRSRRFTLT